MTASLVSFCILFFLCATFFNASHAESFITTTAGVVSKDMGDVSNQPQAGEEYYKLVVRWSNSLCNTNRPTNCGEIPRQDFSIHGLWPAITGSQDPRNCDPTSEFCYRQIHRLEKKLLKFWPDLFPHDPKEHSLLKGQWRSHGTCSGLAQYEYFDMALNVFQNIHPLQTLGKLGVNPRNAYNPEDIINGWYQSKGAWPMIVCNEDYYRTEQLYELRFNVSKDGKNIRPWTGYDIDCSSRTAVVEFPVWKQISIL